MAGVGRSRGSGSSRPRWASSGPRSAAAVATGSANAHRISPGRPLIGHLATLDPNKGTNDLVPAVLPAERVEAGRRPGLSGPGRRQLAALRGVRRWAAGRVAALADPDRPAAGRREGRLLRRDRRLLRCPRGPTRSASSSSRPGPTASRSSPRRPAGSPRSSSTTGPACSSSFGDVERLTLALDWLIHHPETARRLGEAGRDRVARGFDLGRLLRDGRRAARSAPRSGLPADRPRSPHRPSAPAGVRAGRSPVA